MKKSIIISLLLVFVSNFIYSQSNIEQTITKVLILNKISDLDTLSINPCSSLSFEFIGLYPIFDTIPRIISDTSIVKCLLIKKGFYKTDFSWGNWERGPRFTELKYVKGDCNCVIYKKYYYNDKHKNNYYDLRVTERLICNSSNFMDD